MRWTEPAFWNTSLRAWDLALSGYLKSKGIGPTSGGMTAARLAELKQQYPD